MLYIIVLHFILTVTKNSCIGFDSVQSTDDNDTKLNNEQSIRLMSQI